MKEILIWVAVWYSVWFVWEALTRKIMIKIHDRIHILEGFHFLIASIMVIFLYNPIYQKFITQYITSVLISTVSLLIIKFIAIKRNKLIYRYDHLIFYSMCILFQQLMLFKIWSYIYPTISSTNFSHIIFGFFFFLTHLPILFIKWNSLRYFYLLSSFFGGIIFSFIFDSSQYGILLSYGIHYALYILVIPNTQDYIK